MEVILIRHAESLFNCKQSTHPDSELSELGIKQAIQTGEFLVNITQNKTWDFHVSPFRRTKQTCTEIINHLIWNANLSYYINYNWLLREHIYKSSDFAEQFPIHIDEELGYSLHSHETDEECLDRMKNFWNSLDKSQNHVIISHGTPIMVLYELAKNNTLFSLPKWDKSFMNCSVGHFRDGEVLLDRYVGHQHE